MIKKSAAAVILVVLIIIAAVVYYEYPGGKKQKYRGPVEKITVAAAEYLTGALVYVAEDQGFFKEHGLDVEITGYGSGKACADALMDGGADISTSADNVFVSASFEHTDLRVLGTVATRQTKELVARKDKGITAIDDLRGKKIGVTRKSGAEFQLGVFLILNGISEEDVEYVHLKPSEMLDAISNEEVDAVFVWDPYLYNMKRKLGESIISWNGGEEFYFLLLTKKAWIENNSVAAERFIESLLEAEAYIKNNPEEARELVKKRFNYEADYMDYNWPKQEFLVILEQRMLIRLEDQARWRIKHGLTDAKEVPNYLDYIHTDALDEVKPAAVTIIR